MAVRDETNTGRRSQLVGTAYIELHLNLHEPEWFAVGIQLAHNLDTAAYAMLLKLDTHDRYRMLANRNIPASSVIDARKSLDLPLEDEQIPSSLLDSYLSSADDMLSDAAASPDNASGSITTTTGGSPTRQPDSVVSAADFCLHQATTMRNRLPSTRCSHHDRR